MRSFATQLHSFKIPFAVADDIEKLREQAADLDRIIEEAQRLRAKVEVHLQLLREVHTKTVRLVVERRNKLR
jgi:hypothetical protein